MQKTCITLKCLSIGTPTNNKISICSKSKIDYFGCPKIWAHYSLIIMFSNIGTPKNNNFPFATNGKLMVSDVPIFKHFRVYSTSLKSAQKYRAMEFDPEL